MENHNDSKHLYDQKSMGTDIVDVAIRQLQRYSRVFVEQGVDLL